MVINLKVTGRMEKWMEMAFYQEIIGTLLFNDGSKYSGEWSNDMMNGKGI